MTTRPVSIWLAICCLMVYCMIMIGGITRLTQSGLSMVSWEPIMGAIPPLSEADWQQAFSDYQQFPEYQAVNRGMTLGEFKGIFWWEYIHRLLGRLIGVVFFIPMVFFAFTGRLKQSLLPACVGLFVLGGLQGLMGWYMVKSGLVNDPHVSQYRLVAHLSLAVLIYGLMVWLLASQNKTPTTLPGQYRGKGCGLSRLVIVLVGLMIVSGGFMAGTHAGHIFNTFPKMGDNWIPGQLMALSPWWRNFFENTVTIQFQHRIQAAITLACIAWFYLSMQSVPKSTTRTGLNWLMGLALLQISLGITTLVLKVPVQVAAMHQGGAILLLTAAIYTTVQLEA